MLLFVALGALILEKILLFTVNPVYFKLIILSTQYTVCCMQFLELLTENE